MSDDVKQAALEEAQRTYKGFLSLAKKFSIGAVAFGLVKNFNAQAVFPKCAAFL